MDNSVLMKCVNVRQDGYTPFYVALHNDHTDVCKLLWDKGANVNSTGNVSNIILYACCCVYIICYSKLSHSNITVGS